MFENNVKDFINTILTSFQTVSLGCRQRACICDDGEFDAGHAQPQSTVKETKYYLK